MKLLERSIIYERCLKLAYMKSTIKIKIKFLIKTYISLIDMKPKHNLQSLQTLRLSRTGEKRNINSLCGKLAQINVRHQFDFNWNSEVSFALKQLKFTLISTGKRGGESIGKGGRGLGANGQRIYWLPPRCMTRPPSASAATGRHRESEKV